MLVIQKETCPICLIEYQKDKIVITDCYHLLCILCLEKIDKCHMCRTVF